MKVVQIPFLLRAAVVWRLALLLGIALPAVGCGRGLDRCAVDGSVTFDGQPVDRGTIEFSPTAADQPSASGAVVQDGEYSIPRRTGLAPGKYRVRIYSPTPAPARQGPDVPPPVERIPANYNTKTELTVEVTPSGPNTFDFHMD